MLEIRLLGQFEVKLEGQHVEIPSRPAQSLFAYLLLNPGTAHRREKLAGLFWPDATESNARNNLRYVLWRIRKAIEASRAYLIADDLSIAFDASAEYWLDVSVLERKMAEAESAEDLIGVVSVYGGELLPGFYDDWAVLERERLHGVFERKMQALLDRLIEAQRWTEVLEWGERWVALGRVPEPAYRALMIAHSGLGDMSKVAAVYNQCVEAFRRELGVEPSEQTRKLYERLIKGGTPLGPAAAPPSERSDLAGQTIGAYHVVEKLGEGGMAEVYKAYQLRLDRYVALKFIRTELAAQEGFLPRFEQEAKVLARLSHPNIVHVYDFGEEGRRCYLAMEYVAGSTLKDWLRENAGGQPMALDEALLIIRQVCAALDYAHAQSVVHRDVKPANIMLTPDGRALLNDFGIAKLLDKASDVTGTGMTTGTPTYMSPEQISADSSKIGSASDVYSLAIVIYEMLTGRVPFTAETGVAVMLKHLQDPTPPPRLHNPNLSESVEQVILKALAKDPADRYQRAGDLLDALGAAAAGLAPAPAVVAAPPTWVPKVEEDAPAPGEPPFKGLQHFDEADADLFFGREALVAKLVSRLSGKGEDVPTLARPHTPARFLAVVGASGSGKSSLVRAGLIPALKRGERLADGSLPPGGSASWPVYVITPTAHPLEGLAASLTRDSDSVRATATLMDDLAGDPRSLHLYLRRLYPLAPSSLPLPERGAGGEGRLLLVIDQFEELFTLCRNDAERSAFVDNLMAAAEISDGPTAILITLRADFYAHCAQFDNLRQALAQHQEYVGPMSRAEMRRAIEEPANRRGWEFESGLVDLLLQDVGEEPGALPLLSHALLETWQRRRGRMLTFGGYTASGGVRGAIAKTAETVFQKFSPDERAIARNIFLRLTELGEGTQDTRRRASLAELISGLQSQPLVESVLKTLADARLVTTSANSAEVAHEALIREWPTLREWLGENREGLRLHRHLTEAAQAWEKLSHDPGELYRGVRLAQVWEWASEHASEMNALEQEFLDASRAQAEREAVEREAQRQRELEAARKLAEAERRRAEEQARAAGQLRRRAVALAGVLALAILAALAAGVFANRNGTLAAQNAAIANTAQIASTQAIAQESIAQVESNNRATAEAVAVQQRQSAEAQARLALARELAAASISNLEVDPELSVLLAMQAVSVTYDENGTVIREAENALHRALPFLRVRLRLSGHQGSIYDAALSADGARLATASNDKTAKIWNVAPGDLNTDRTPLTLTGHDDWVWGVAFSPDGKHLMTGSLDGTARVWDAATGDELLVLKGHDGGVLGVNFSPDGRLLATGDEQGTMRLWEAATGEIVSTIPNPGGGGSVAFSPDGNYLASSGEANSIILWQVGALVSDTVEPVLTLCCHNSFIVEFNFSPDSTRLATSSDDRTAKVWEVATGQELLTLYGHTAPVDSIAFSADGNLIATGGGDGTTRVWEAPVGATGAREVLSIPSQSVSAYFSPLDDGASLVTASEGGLITVFDIRPSHELLTFSGHTDWVWGLAFSPDGDRLATSSFDGTAHVWQLPSDPSAADEAASQQPLTLTGHADWVNAITFSPDGRRLVTGSNDATAKVWDAATGDELFTFTGHTYTPDGFPYNGVGHAAFSPDGKSVATSGGDGMVQIWEAETGQVLSVFTAHTRVVTGLAFNADGTRLATVSFDGTAKVWDVEQGQTLFTLTLPDQERGLWSFGFSQDGTRLAVAQRDGTVTVWGATPEADHDKPLLTLTGHTSIVTGVTFSADGMLLATASFDGTAKVWNAVTGEEVLTLTGHDGGVTNVAFSPDGNWLATVSHDGTARLYVLPVEDLMALARTRLTRTLTKEECQRFLHSPECPP